MTKRADGPDRRSFEYSKERILKIVNDMTGADFDAIEVADEYSGFRIVICRALY